MIALYASLGGFILLITHGLWYEGHSELGIPLFYQLTLLKSALWGSLSFIGFVPIVVATSFYLAKKKPFNASMVNLFLNTLILVTTMFVTLGSMVWASFSLLFMVANGAIVAFSSYFYVFYGNEDRSPPPNSKYYFEALKLEHDWILRVTNTLSWVVMIIVVSAWLVSWNQTVVPSIPEESRLTLGFVKLQTTQAIQIIYLGLGTWFGIIGKLLNRAQAIHEIIKKIEKK